MQQKEVSVFRVVYFNGITVKDIWFETDRGPLDFSKANPSFKILEWKKYEQKEDARPLANFTW